MTSTDLMNVNAFENQTPDGAFAALNPQDESLADGIGSSYGVISYKGKVWSLKYKGNTHTFVRADDGTAAAFLDVIVLRSAGYKSKSYYPKGSFDQDQSGGRPTCSSLDGIVPDRDVQQPQSNACAICPRNEWKQEGQRKSRECSDYKRLAVLLLPAQSKLLLGDALMEPVFLRIPPASLNDLAALGDAMSKKGFHYSSYITRVGFVAEKPHPQMTFKALQKLGNQEAAIVMPMREDPLAYRITGEGDLAAAGTMRAVQGPKTIQPAISVSQPAIVSQPVGFTSQEDPAIAAARKLIADAEAKAAEIVRAAGAASGTTVIPPAVTKPIIDNVVGLGAQNDVVEAGFGDLGSNPASVAGPIQSPTATVEDTGGTTDSDVDLDARVAAMLTR